MKATVAPAPDPKPCESLPPIKFGPGPMTDQVLPTFVPSKPDPARELVFAKLEAGRLKVAGLLYVED
jgi:hypothetical protein